MTVRKHGERGQNTTIVKGQVGRTAGTQGRGQQGTARPSIALPKGGSVTAQPKPPPSTQK